MIILFMLGLWAYSIHLILRLIYRVAKIYIWYLIPLISLSVGKEYLKPLISPSVGTGTLKNVPTLGVFNILF